MPACRTARRAGLAQYLSGTTALMGNRYASLSNLAPRSASLVKMVPKSTCRRRQGCGLSLQERGVGQGAGQVQRAARGDCAGSL